MAASTFRQQLRIAEICKTAGDQEGYTRALARFLLEARVVADTLYPVGESEIYTEMARASTELIQTLVKRGDLKGATGEAHNVADYFAGSMERLSRVDVEQRAFLMATVAASIGTPALRASLFGAAALDFAKVDRVEDSARARLGEALGLFELRQYRKAHEQALLSSKLAQGLGNYELEAQAVRQLAVSFWTARDTSSAIGILHEYLERTEGLAAGMSEPETLMLSRAEICEALAQLYLAIENKNAARSASKQASKLYAQGGDHARSAKAWGLA